MNPACSLLKVTTGFSNLLSNHQRRPKPFRRSPHVVGQQNPASARYACDEQMQGLGIDDKTRGQLLGETVDVLESNTRSFAIHSLQRWMDPFLMLTFLGLFESMHIISTWFRRLVGLLPAPNLECEDVDNLKQAPLPGLLGSGVATGVPCPGGKQARPDTCFMTHRYVPCNERVTDECHIIIHCFP